MNDVILTKAKIDEIFSEAKHQQDYLSALYDHCIPKLERLSQIHLIKSSRKCGEYLTQKAIEFDRKHHPIASEGGLWLLYGIGVSDEIIDPDVDQFLIVSPSYKKK